MIQGSHWPLTGRTGSHFQAGTTDPKTGFPKGNGNVVSKRWEPGPGGGGVGAEGEPGLDVSRTEMSAAQSRRGSRGTSKTRDEPAFQRKW